MYWHIVSFGVEDCQLYPYQSVICVLSYDKFFWIAFLIYSRTSHCKLYLVVAHFLLFLFHIWVSITENWVGCWVIRCRTFFSDVLGPDPGSSDPDLFFHGFLARFRHILIWFLETAMATSFLPNILKLEGKLSLSNDHRSFYYQICTEDSNRLFSSVLT